MKAKISYLNVCLCSLIASAAITLNACSLTDSAGSGPEISQQAAFASLTRTTQEYQQQVENSDGDSRFNSTILLCRSQIVSGNIDDAAATLSTLKKTAVSQEQQDATRIVEAILLSRSGKNQQALKILESLNPMVMPQQTAAYYYGLSSTVNQRLYRDLGNVDYQFTAYQNKKNIIEMVKGQNRSTVIRQCADILDPLTDSQLSQKLQSTHDVIDRGFYEYSMICNSSSETLRNQLLSEFKSKNPNHPVTELIHDGPQMQNSVVTAADNGDHTGSAAATGVFSLKPDATIAVMLLLSGRFAANIGEPAKQGILASLNDHSARFRVVFYDTNKQNITDILNSAKGEGAALIIGPILKPEVAALNQASSSLPSIVLNKPETRAGDQWYFDLGPDYEGAIAAAKMHSDGHHSPVIVASTDKQSSRAASAFARSMSGFGGSVQTCTYQDPSRIKTDLASCPLQNAEAVYINARSEETVTIKGLIPASVPVYLTDASYDGFNNSAQELALNGALLGDMPWLLTESEAKKSFMKVIPKANSQAQRIFAAGYDSISLALSIDELAKNSKDVLHGLTGDISLGKNGLIDSSPMWVKLGQVRSY